MNPIALKRTLPFPKYNKDSFFPLYTVLFTLLACMILPGSLISESLQYDRTAIEQGELWRLITCHWTHFANHLVWDVAAFVGLGYLCERINKKGFFLCLVSGVLSISISLWILEPDLMVYRGISGVDVAMFSFAAIFFLWDSLKRGDKVTTFLTVMILCGFAGKTVYEFVNHATLFARPDKSFEVVPLSHLVGAISGAVTAIYCFTIKKLGK